MAATMAFKDQTQLILASGSQVALVAPENLLVKVMDSQNVVLAETPLSNLEYVQFS